MLFTTRRPGAVKAAPTHREPTHTYTLLRGMFSLLNEMKKMSARVGGGKFYFITR